MKCQLKNYRYFHFRSLCFHYIFYFNLFRPLLISYSYFAVYILQISLLCQFVFTIYTIKLTKSQSMFLPYSSIYTQTFSKQHFPWSNFSSLVSIYNLSQPAVISTILYSKLSVLLQILTLLDGNNTIKSLQGLE